LASSRASSSVVVMGLSMSTNVEVKMLWNNDS
jgi:hypothetical protein